MIGRYSMIRVPQSIAERLYRQALARADQEGPAIPGPTDVVFELLLARLHPRSVVMLHDFDRGMTEQDRYMRQLYTAKQQRHGEGVSKAMRVSTLDHWVGRREYLQKDAIPALDRRFTLASAVPKKVLGMRFERSSTLRPQSGGADSTRGCRSFACT